MSRGLANVALAELYVGNTSGEWLVLLTIAHSALPATLRYVNDRQNVTSSGNVFTALGFSARLPADRNEPARALITLDAVDQAVITGLRTITTPATVTVQLIRRSAPSTILASWSLEMRGAHYTATTATIELSPEPVLDESYPGTDFTPLLFPAMFDR